MEENYLYKIPDGNTAFILLYYIFGMKNWKYSAHLCCGMSMFNEKDMLYIDF